MRCAAAVNIVELKYYIEEIVICAGPLLIDHDDNAQSHESYALYYKLTNLDSRTNNCSMYFLIKSCFSKPHDLERC